MAAFDDILATPDEWSPPPEDAYDDEKVSEYASYFIGYRSHLLFSLEQPPIMALESKV